MLFFWKDQSHIWKGRIFSSRSSNLSKSRSSEYRGIILSNQEERIDISGIRKTHYTNIHNIFFSRKEWGFHPCNKTSKCWCCIDKSWFHSLRRSCCWTSLSWGSSSGIWVHARSMLMWCTLVVWDTLLFLRLHSCRAHRGYIRSESRSKINIMAIAKNMVHKKKIMLFTPYIRSICDK